MKSSIIITEKGRINKMQGTLQDHCRMYLGVKPYDTDTNVIKHDPYFLMSMETLQAKQAVKKHWAKK